MASRVNFLLLLLLAAPNVELIFCHLHHLLLILQSKEIGLRVEPTIRDRFVFLLLECPWSRYCEIRLVATPHLLGLEWLAQLVACWRELLLDLKFMVRSWQGMRIKVLDGFTRSIVLVVGLVVNLMVRGECTATTPFDILIEDGSYRLIVLSTILIETGWGHMEILNFKVLDPVFLRFIMIPKLD